MSENQLTVIQDLTPAEVYGNDNIKSIVAAITKEAKDFTPDLETTAGRKEIASMAYKVAQSKTLLDKFGKSLTEEQRKTIDAVNAERKYMRDELEALKEEVRRPLTEWENIEKERVEKHMSVLKTIEGLKELFGSYTSQDIKERIDRLNNEYKREWEEFDVSAEQAYEDTLTFLSAEYGEKKRQEEEAAELAKLRAEKEDREQKEREEKIAKDAAEKARVEAEEKAKAEKAKVEREKAQAEAQAEKEKNARLQAERDAEVAKEQAATQERERIAAEQKAEEEAAAKREADKQHKAKIHNEILEAIQNAVDFGNLGEDPIKDIVVAIAKGEVPHVQINY